jgi:hypothetical protein
MAEKKVIELEVSSNLGNLKQQLKQAQVEVQTLADKFGATSAQAVEAAKKAAVLKDKISDAKALTDAFNPDAKFKALSGSLTGVAGGFSVVTGAMAAFGKQNEDVEKALLKVQGAMALASGAQAIGESIDSFKQLGAVIKATSIYQAAYNFVQTGSITATAESTVAKIADTEATVAQGTAMVVTTTATTGASAAAKVLRAALISTGVGALVVGVGLLIENFDYLKEKFNGLGTGAKVLLSMIMPVVGVFWALSEAYNYFASDSIKANAKAESAIKKNTAALKEQIKSSEKSSEALKTKNGHEYEMAKASGASTKALRALALKHAEEEVALNKASLATAKNTYEKNKNTLANLINTGASDELIEKQREVTIESRKASAEERKDLEEALKNKKAIINKNAVEVRQELTDNNNKVKDANKTHNEAIKQQNEEAAKTELERVKTLNENIASLNEEIRVSNLTDQEKEVDAINKKYTKLIEEGKKAKIDVTTLEEEKRLGLAAITKKYDDADASTRLTNSQTVISEMVAAGTKRLEGEKLTSEKSIEIAKAEAEQKAVIQQENLDIASKGIGVIKGLFEKSKGVQKAAVIAESAIGIAKMIIATRAGNIAARSSGAALSIASGGASVIAAEGIIARNNISTGIGIAANIAATAKALNALGGGGAPSGSVGGGGGGGGGGATAPNMSAPQFNVVGQSGVNQLASLNQQPIQAYVVSGQVTSQQALDRNRLANATLGG